eukprot:TRINITY_DN2765_c0_g1_i1.p1 TRINITY_DN2765_c0_g1~~TRINITY_DN2765_c0_g1_i1.p1  ORF type:complete len:251 (-),score=23.61 TRINITY_DN2765_c0_g1_i1:26-778(-)
MAAAPVLVFGGRGMVGAGICRELARRGLPVVSLGRSAGVGGGGDIGPGVEHRHGIDALKLETYKPVLRNARAVVIAIGEAPWTERFGGSHDQAVRMNGETNVSVLQAAAEARIPCAVLVNATMPTWRLIRGYREGKEMAETEARRYAESSNLTEACRVLVLKPGVVSGTRYVGRVPLPLWLIFSPMRLVMRCFSGPCRWLETAMPNLCGGILRPPVNVEELARAAADEIESEARHGVRTLGPEALAGYSS